MKKKARLLLIPLVTLVVAADNSQDSASRKDPNALQGTWNLVSAMEDGNALPEDKVKKTPIVFKDDGFHFPGSAEYATSRAEKIKVDATKSPKQMHAISTKKEVMLGIYELNGDSYKACFAPVGKPRPSDLASTAGTGQILPNLAAPEEEAVITRRLSTLMQAKCRPSPVPQPKLHRRFRPERISVFASLLPVHRQDLFRSVWA